jgi:hypothetical protein
MNIVLQRKIFNTEGDRSTIGELFIDDIFFCYTLEDEVRADGNKVFGKTAIPAIEYDVTITYSPKFKRETVLLYNQKDLSISYEGVSFTSVRVHGGNTAADSHGCPLIAFNTDGKKIWGSAESNFTKIVKKAIGEGKEVKFKVEVKPFNQGLTNKMS